MQDVCVVCCQFKLLRENFRLNIKYSLIECYKHSIEKVIVYLIYGDDKSIDVKTETEKFENIIKDSLLKNFVWYIVPKYIEYKANAKLLEYDNVVEFVLKRKTVETSTD